MSPGTVACTAPMAEFGKTVADAYRFEGESIELGRGVHEGKVVEEAVIRLPLPPTVTA